MQKENPVSQAANADAVLGLIENPELKALLHRWTRKCIAWNDFLRMPLPPGMSAMEAWDFTLSLRRACALYFPIPDVQDWDYWYTLTHQISAAVATIECACKEDSSLHQALTAASGQKYLVRSMIEESVAAAQLDGLETVPEKTRELLSLDRAPRNANERLITNTLSVAYDLREYVDEPFSRDLLFHFHERVLKDIDPDKLRTTSRRQGFGQEDFSEVELELKADRQIEYLCDYANGVTGDRFDHPVVRALIIRDSIRGYRVMPVASGSVGRLVFALYALKNHLPVLAMLPISKSSLEWEAGITTIPSYPSHDTLYKLQRHREYDITPYVTITTQLTLQTLRDLIGYIDRSTQHDEEMRARLQADPLLNHRQRSILGRALRNPNAEFRIRYHKTQHNVAYATARADLIELAEKGYLIQEQRGKAFVFVPHPELESRLSTE